jgi:hypothetical protein
MSFEFSTPFPDTAFVFSSSCLRILFSDKTSKNICYETLYLRLGEISSRKVLSSFYYSKVFLV